MHKLTPADLESVRQRARSDMSLREGRTAPGSSRARDLLLCSGTGCHASGSLAVLDALKHELAEHGLQKDIRIVETGCNGFCAQGPLMLVQPDGILYKKFSIADVPVVVEEHFVQGRPVEKLFYRDPTSKKRIAAMQDIPFYALQQPIVLRNRGMMDAEKITE
jgi:(2Fe-2S) ferredoxin